MAGKAKMAKMSIKPSSPAGSSPRRTGAQTAHGRRLNAPINPLYSNHLLASNGAETSDACGTEKLAEHAPFDGSHRIVTIAETVHGTPIPTSIGLRRKVFREAVCGARVFADQGKRRQMGRRLGILHASKWHYLERRQAVAFWRTGFAMSHPSCPIPVARSGRPGAGNFDRPGLFRGLICPVNSDGSANFRRLTSRRLPDMVFCGVSKDDWRYKVEIPSTAKGASKITALSTLSEGETMDCARSPPNCGPPTGIDK